MVQEIDIPGGRWVIAVTPRNGNFNHSRLNPARVVVALVGGLIAWMLYALIRSRSELTHLVMFDSLTGLPNRRLLADRAGVAFTRLRRPPDQSCAVLFLDLDRFKHINGRCGHKAGDAVLRETANRCRAIVRAEDTAARWGGDEFVVLIEEISEEAVEALATRLRNALKEPISFNGRQVESGASIGMVLHHEGDAGLDEVIETADRRMYIDKLRRRETG